MRVTYSLQVCATCPVDNLADLYDVEITSSEVITVEAILDAVETINKKDFQENITVALARELPALVKTTGWHSGVKTVCEA